MTLTFAPKIKTLIELLEEDKRRLDFLDETKNKHVMCAGARWYARKDYGQSYNKFDSIREAIDYCIPIEAKPEPTVKEPTTRYTRYFKVQGKDVVNCNTCLYADSGDMNSFCTLVPEDVDGSNTTQKTQIATYSQNENFLTTSCPKSKDHLTYN